MRGLVSIIFLIHLVITQGDNSDKTRKLDQMSIKIESSRTITMQSKKQIPKKDILRMQDMPQNKTQVETVNFRLYYKVIIRQNEIQYFTT